MEKKWQISGLCPTNKTMQTRCLSGFWYVGKIIRMFGPKTANCNSQDTFLLYHICIESFRMQTSYPNKWYFLGLFVWYSYVFPTLPHSSLQIFPNVFSKVSPNCLKVISGQRLVEFFRLNSGQDWKAEILSLFWVWIYVKVWFDQDFNAEVL